MRLAVSNQPATATHVHKSVIAFALLLASGVWSATPAFAQATDTAGTTAAMDHSDMPPMQGGDAPVDARNPDSYANGFERGSGKYALPGQPRLQLDDEHSFSTLWVNRLERVWKRGDDATSYDLQSRIGRDVNALGIKAEGEVEGSRLDDSRTEVYWSHAVAPYWDTQVGVRHDGGAGPNRVWLALGVQGLAPYWFELGATGYVRNGGHLALRLEAEYDWLLTSKVSLQPSTELSFYSKDDPDQGVGKGLSSINAALRLRYEVTRQVMPYVGVEWQRSFGRTTDILQTSGESPSQTHWVMGISFWF